MVPAETPNWDSRFWKKALYGSCASYSITNTRYRVFLKKRYAQPGIILDNGLNHFYSPEALYQLQTKKDVLHHFLRSEWNIKYGGFWGRSVTINWTQFYSSFSLIIDNALLIRWNICCQNKKCSFVHGLWFECFMSIYQCSKCYLM